MVLWAMKNMFELMEIVMSFIQIVLSSMLFFLLGGAFIGTVLGLFIAIGALVTGRLPK